MFGSEKSRAGGANAIARLARPEKLRSSLTLAIIFGAGMVSSLALASIAAPGPGIKVDWDAVAAVATALAVVAAVTMWNTDAAERRARSDAAAKVTTLLLLPELSAARSAVESVLPGIDAPDDLSRGILDIMIGDDANQRAQIAVRAEEVLASALAGLEPRLDLLPSSLAGPLAHALVGLKGLKHAANHLQSLDAHAPEAAETGMDGLRRAYQGARSALEEAHAACEAFVIEELEDHCR